MTGPYHHGTWHSDERSVDFFDIKGAVEALLKALGLQGVLFKKHNDLLGYDPGVSSGIYCSGSLIGRVGRVSSRAMRACDLEKEDAYLFELDIEALLKNFSLKRQFRPFAKFPAVYRDISMIVKRQLESAGIQEIINQEGRDLVESVQIFDLYEGKNMDPSEKAIGFRVCYRSEQRTLDGTEVNRLHESIIDKIRQETGGRLKGG